MDSSTTVRRPSFRRILTLSLLLLVAVPPAGRAAEELKLTAAQLQSLEATRKGFGKGKKLQAEIVKQLGQAAETNRAQLALRLAVVVAEKWPDEAADAVGKLVELVPAQAVPLVHAALKAAPKQARPIASAAMSASPSNSVLIASAAVQLVPGEANAILEAASWRVPKELKPQLDQLRATAATPVTRPAKPLRIENPVAN